MEEIFGMSNKEIERLKILSDIIEGKITQLDYVAHGVILKINLLLTKNQ